LEFNNISTKDDVKIYECWQYKGYYLFPAIQELIFWEFFVGIVQYKEIRKKLEGRNFEIRNPDYFINGRLKRINDFLYGKHRLWKKIIYNFFSFILRRFISFSSCVLVNDDGVNGFRYKIFKERLGSLTQFSRVERLTQRRVKDLFSEKNTLIFGSYHILKKKAPPNFDYESLDTIKDYIKEDEFHRLIQAINDKYYDIVKEVKIFEKDQRIDNINFLLTYDQIENILPLVIALKLKNKKVFSFQHGPITKYHAGWNTNSIPISFCNLISDTLFVWGDYWERKLIEISSKYNVKNIVTGAHLNKKIDYKKFNEIKKTKKQNLGKLSILVPYEFLADNLEVSEYIEIFIDLGWSVDIKIRPIGAEGDISVDMKSYTKKVRDNVNYAYEIDESRLVEYDAVVCTQSVFAVEMMRFKVPIWYIRTSVSFLEDLIKDGLAHEITLDTVKSFQKDIHNVVPYLEAKYKISEFRDVFSDKSLTSVLQSILLSNRS